MKSYSRIYQSKRRLSNTARVGRAERLIVYGVTSRAMLPSHLSQLNEDTPYWSRWVPSRLVGTASEVRKQVWYIKPKSWEGVEGYCQYHETEAHAAAHAGGIGILVYDLSELPIVDHWQSSVLPFAKMHQRLHLDETYAKWLKCVYVIVPNDIVYTLLSTILSGAWKPTRPTHVIQHFDELVQELEKIWRPKPLR
eukprot:4750086-Prymnesium_polylepis.3